MSVNYSPVIKQWEQHLPFIRTILDNPHDDQAKLVYADALQDEINPGTEDGIDYCLDRSEFIRLSASLNTTLSMKEQADIVLRQQLLLSKYYSSKRSLKNPMNAPWGTSVVNNAALWFHVPGWLGAINANDTPFSWYWYPDAHYPGFGCTIRGNWNYCGFIGSVICSWNTWFGFGTNGTDGFPYGHILVRHHPIQKVITEKRPLYLDSNNKWRWTCSSSIGHYLIAGRDVISSPIFNYLQKGQFTTQEGDRGGQMRYSMARDYETEEAAINDLSNAMLLHAYEHHFNNFGQKSLIYKDSPCTHCGTEFGKVTGPCWEAP